MTDAAALGGVGLLGYGLWLASPALLCIAGGAALIGGAFWWAWSRGQK